MYEEGCDCYVLLPLFCDSRFRLEECTPRLTGSTPAVEKLGKARDVSSRFGFGILDENWALEYHTLILFSYRNHYEIKVYTFFSLVT